MKRLFLSLLLLLSYVCAFAQVPQAINYQAIARDAHGNVLIEKHVSIKLAILRGSATGTVIYEETHAAKSGNTGVINLQIGKGTPVTGTFSAIDWSQSPYFIRFSMDATGGTSYKEVATTQMLSVPYALYAETAGSVNGVTPSANQDFLVFSDTQAELFAGANPEIEAHSYSGIRGSVVYLNNEDQEIRYELKGLPDGITIEDNSSASGKYGKYVNFYFNGYTEEESIYNCSLVLTNKYGVTKSYPFILKTFGKPVIIDPDPDGFFKTDEDYRMYKNALLEKWSSIVVFDNYMDVTFIEKENLESFDIFYNKTYTPSDYGISYYWSQAYYLIQRTNLVIENLEKQESLSGFRKHILSQAKIMRAYTNLKLTEWFNRVPLVLTTNSEDYFYPQSSREEILNSVILDLEYSLLNIHPDDEVYISFDVANARLIEAYLLNKQWSKVLEKTQQSSSALINFYCKVANYKSDQISNITNESLFNEYMSDHYDENVQGNLLLNILDYSAEYFGWDDNHKYKAILPIPMEEVGKNPNLTQNPGYY